MPSGLPADTTPEALRVQFEVLRKMGMEGRARMTFDLSHQLRRICESGVRLRHPDYSDEQVRLAAIRLSLGDELFVQVYGHISVEP